VSCDLSRQELLPLSHSMLQKTHLTQLALVLVMTMGHLILADVTIDLAKAVFDENLGQFCVMQKVCVANPPEALTSAGCAPKFPPGCDCDPEADEADSTCSAGTSCVQCKCLPLGCDCDPNADDPNSFCPSGDICKDCTCQPPFPPGCDCDPAADDPDSSCSAGNECVQCKCLPLGCECDETADDPDSFCPAGHTCQNCKCQKPLPPGCDCDSDSENPDYLCPADLRCVGCKCQSCPQSGGQGLGQGRDSNKVLNPPLIFVIDTTKSVKPDKDSIFNLTKRVTDRIMNDKINIPRFQLISFNDYGREINRNVRLEIDTDDVGAFARATSSLVFESFDGGRDSRERLTQGLLVALQNAPDRSLIVVFTDNGTKDLDLEKEIIRIKKAREIEVFIVLTPAYEGRFNGPDLPAYGRMGKVFLINEVGADSFLRDVQTFEESNCL